MQPDGFERDLSFATESLLAGKQTMRRLAETADYVSQRVLQLGEQMHEAEQAVVHMSALTRQLRTLASNTALEATRMKMGGPLAEIARQMRRISQQISESNDQLAITLRSYAVATGELYQTATNLVGDTKSAMGEVSAQESELIDQTLSPTPSRAARRSGRPRATDRTDHADEPG
jgi:methyl-accepting chemotaxis protein